jgi:hypothetical protein
MLASCQTSRNEPAGAAAASHRAGGIAARWTLAAKPYSAGGGQKNVLREMEEISVNRVIMGQTPNPFAVPPSMPDRLAQALMSAVPSGTRTVLHVGCGPADERQLHRSFQDGDWRELRVDVNPAVAPDIVAPMTDMRMVADASVDAVWSHRALETLSPQQMPQALAEFQRVLDEDGFALLALAEPHIAATRLQSALIEAGFARVETWETASELWARAHKSPLPTALG